MTRRHPRVPPTYADKVRRIAAVAREHATGPGVYVIDMAHDEGCPALEKQSIAACTCEPEIRLPERVA